MEVHIEKKHKDLKTGFLILTDRDAYMLCSYTENGVCYYFYHH
ncbi:hypothetical protein [uncultured Clostridium sp.]|nr:hypothetical protein [uncultured Clostridium sp.]